MVDGTADGDSDGATANGAGEAGAEGARELLLGEGVTPPPQPARTSVTTATDTTRAPLDARTNVVLGLPIKPPRQAPSADRPTDHVTLRARPNRGQVPLDPGRRQP